MNLKDGETICPECNGTGRSLRGKDEKDPFGWLFCPKCVGSGKLDWVEMVVGKRLVFHFTDPISTHSYRGIKGEIWNR
jgi:hypothetical protein